MKQTRIWSLLIVALLAAFLVACGGGSNANDEVANSGGAGLAIDESQQSMDANGIPVGVTSDGHPYWGYPEAPIVIEEYSDFQCPFCARHQAQTMPSLYREQIETGQVVYIFKDFTPTLVNPSYHPQAILASTAGECAQEQGAFWPMHDILFARQAEWGNSNAAQIMTGYADEIGLDTDLFAKCLTAERHNDTLRLSYEEGQRRGVTGTPGFFINGAYLSGAQPLNVFNQYIAAAQAGELPAVADTTTQAEPQQPAPAPTPASIAADDYAFAMGDPNAPVTLVEYTDYQCPFCARHALETGPSILTEMIETGRVYYMLKDMPLDNLHAEAREAAAAARCAGDQDAYWEMHEILFARQADWSDQGDEHALATFTGYAAELELDTDEFDACLAEGKYDAAVQTNVAEGASLGVTGTPYFFIDGYPLNGARPFETFALAVGYAEEGTLAEAYAPTQPTQPQAPPPPAGPVVVDLGDAPSLGDPNAPIVIVEYSDFQCPFCARHFNETIPELMRNYVDTGQVRYVFKHFTPTFVNPSYHPQAIAAAMASECAKEQGAFWEMHDILFARQAAWGNNNALVIFEGYASELGLDVAQFEECMTTDRYLDVIQADFEQGRELGVTGTPNFFINGNLLSGAQPFSVFQQAIATFADAVPSSEN